jgi:hypothetical protein
MTISNLCFGRGFGFVEKPTPSQLQTSLKVRHSAARAGIFSKVTRTVSDLKKII